MLLGLFAVNMGNPTWEPDRLVVREGRGRNTLDDGNSDGRSFVGLGLSCNGRDWSALRPIAETVGALGRTYDHPVDGLLEIEERGDSTMGGGVTRTVSVLIHRDVFEISPRAEVESRIVRRELKLEALERLAGQVRGSLPGCREGLSSLS